MITPKVLPFIISIFFLICNLQAFEIKARYQRSGEDFTQGLLYKDGLVYEGTGRYGKSVVKTYDLKDRKTKKQTELDPHFFGEGIALLQGQLYQLTWKSGVVFAYDTASLKPKGQYRISGQGWGLSTWKDSLLILSNGSDELYFYDARFLLHKKIKVNYKGKPVVKLNELEVVGNFVYANVWQTNYIYKIDLKTGNAVERYDLSQLAQNVRRLAGNRIDVLNGIAYIPEKKTFLVTGKLWPLLYEIQL